MSSKRRYMAIFFFFFEKSQELPSGSGNLFPRTQFSQPITFKIVIAGFLNKQCCNEMELFPRNPS